jgi:hypothetical protein
VIRGAFILAVGFALGYAKALHDNPDIHNILEEAKEFLVTLKDTELQTDPPKTTTEGE